MWLQVMNKDFFRRLSVIIAVLVSGLGLSLLFVVRISVIDLIMLSAAPIAAFTLLPKTDWSRVGAYVFLMAGVYGIGRVASEVAHSVLERTPMLGSWSQYGVEVLVYVVYSLIWLTWWTTHRANSRRRR